MFHSQSTSKCNILMDEILSIPEVYCVHLEEKALSAKGTLNRGLKSNLDNVLIKNLGSKHPFQYNNAGDSEFLAHHRLRVAKPLRYLNDSKHRPKRWSDGFKWKNFKSNDELPKIGHTREHLNLNSKKLSFQSNFHKAEWNTEEANTQSFTLEKTRRNVAEDPLEWGIQPQERTLFSNNTGGMVHCSGRSPDGPTEVAWFFEDGRPVEQVRK